MGHDTEGRGAHSSPGLASRPGSGEMGEALVGFGTIA